MMHSRRRLPTVLGVIGLVVTWGIMFWLWTHGSQLVQTLQPTPTILEAWLEATRIHKTDFPTPDAWQAYEPYSEAVVNTASSTVYAFNHTDAFWIKVSQRIRIYPDAAAAQTAYNHALYEWFTAEWEPPAALVFSGHADMLTLRCIEAYVDNIHHYPCRAIGVYGDTVIILLANVFDERWFTMDDFAHLLTVMDQRMVAALGQR